jgi:type IX secretion system PorP/SprF family membrane protein
MQSVRKILLCAFIAVALVPCKAQSYHFSQFYSTPLLNNPASTGNIDGSFRAATNFRSQWAQGSSPYLTSSLSIDTKIFGNRIPENNKAGAGIYFMNDQSAGGALQTNSIGFSTAYHLSLDTYGEQTIGIGLQGVLSQRRIDYSKLSFETQYGSNGYDPSLPVGEPLNLGDKVGFDANAGLLYNYKHDYNAFFAGAAVYNTFRHNESADINSFKTPMRISVLSGGHLAIGYDQTLYASVNYMNQAKASELTIGAAYGYQIGTDKTQEINFGIWHRVKDAIIPYVGYQLNGFQAGLSYDYTISKIKTGSLSKNGFELTLIYQGNNNSQDRRLMPWY